MVNDIDLCNATEKRVLSELVRYINVANETVNPLHYRLFAGTIITQRKKRTRVT